MKIILFLLLLPNFSKASLQEFCENTGGRLEKGYKCPNTSFPLIGNVCFFKNNFGEEHFSDGCTGPSGGHNKIFLKACIKHDLCYHHEPSSNKKDQQTCDKEFFGNLNNACEKAQNIPKCQKWAKIMYGSLKAFGSLAYRCDDQLVQDYLR